MSGHYIRKRARSAGWGFSLAVFAAALLLVGLTFFRMGAVDLDAFTLTLLFAAALVALSLVFSLFAISRAWGYGHRGGGRALAALLVGLVVVLPYALGAALAIEYPAGNQAATRGFATTAPTATDMPASLLPGRDYRATAADVYEAAQGAMSASGWQVLEVETRQPPEPADGNLGISGTVLAPVPTLRDTLEAAEDADPLVAMDSDEYTITAVATAPIFGFPSDVTLRIVEEDGTSYVDMRAVSRGLSRDLGQNRRFIHAFFARLDEAMTLLQTGALEE
ncbi:DUF1499 domain-containing protein [Aureimonas populi]|uniref:DUF1499 domain-containing protein n=1 Tax=Aureimonas populi TaxID=1701758 RepID=A0ABW5CP84_9HYPH|nr:DUF1499 domain-containing protein [Aureimonas populi]